MEEKNEENTNSGIFNHKKRKGLHYILIGCIVLLQLLLLYIVYNKFFVEPKKEQLETELHIAEQAKYFNDLTRSNYISAQFHLQNYLLTNDSVSLQKYNLALDSLNHNIQKLAQTTNKSDLFSLYLKKESRENFSISNISSKIDSIRGLDVSKNIALTESIFKLNNFQYKDLIDHMHVETSSSVDSVQRKGLFSRVGDAIKGKVDVQKEKVNVILTLGNGRNSTTGNIEDQLEKLFKNINNHYQNEIRKQKRFYENKLNNKNQNDSQFSKMNNELLSYSSQILDKYNTALVAYTSEARKNFQEQVLSDKKTENLFVIGLVLLIILVSLVLAYMTNLTFVYEKKLQKAKESIAQNLKFKNRIVGMISHEIRAPLNIISIYSRGIKQQVEDIEIKESLKTIEDTSQSLSMLANQILDYSKNENKKITINPKSFQLKTELDKIVKPLHQLASNNGNTLQIQSNVETKLPSVYSDATKIQQLFYNLFANANKFTQDGLINVSMRSTYSINNSIKLEVEVKDNGVGIDEEDLKNIFEEFEQGAISENVKNLGVGLGLNLCKEIVELFNGEIEVTSQKNVETIVRFYLMLPIEKQ